MDSEIQKIVSELKETISKKYDLQELRLFGSSARGERKKDSDIDIFVCLLENFKPGQITRDGFLGDDSRHIHDIIKEDLLTLSRLGVTVEELAERLQYFIDEGKKGLETIVDLGDYTVQITWDRGLLPCPFGEPRRHHKIIAKLYNKKLGKAIRYSQLNVHTISEHGFFEGKGSAFRLEPGELVEMLGLKRT